MTDASDTNNANEATSGAADEIAACDISVIIPTLNAAKHLPGLLEILKSQCPPPKEIVIVDSSSDDDTAKIAADAGCVVSVIDRRDFNHGTTRNYAATLATGDIYVFLTQDVLPIGDDFLSTLTEPLRSGRAAAACARQLTADYAQPTERLTREFNYPAKSHIRSRADVAAMGYKAYFISNAAAAYRRDAFESVGGFDSDVIMCEDVLICAKIIAADYSVAYCGGASVSHTHNYNLAQQFRRYFDIGVFMANNRQRLTGAATSSEGLRMCRHLLGRLLGEGRPLWAAYSIVEAGVKFVAMKLGRAYKMLPRFMVVKCSMHKGFWRGRSW